MIVLEILFWATLGALVWTHVGYPLFAWALARLRPRRVNAADSTPSVVVIVAAHDEDEVIARRLENLLALDYPSDLLQIVVASDASTDRTDAIVEEFAAREPRVRLVAAPRGGKVAAQNLAVDQTESDVVAFSDANSTWAPDALRRLVRGFADPEVAYVCGRLQLERRQGEIVQLIARMMRKLAAVYFPLYAGLLVTGREFVTVLFTERYDASWPIFAVNLTLIPLCILTAAWAEVSRSTGRVQGALLVAPGDPEREELQGVLPSWTPIVRQRPPFPSTLVGSRNDPYCSFEKAQSLADSWGSRFVDFGERGHINAESGLGDWPEGMALLNELTRQKEH